MEQPGAAPTDDVDVSSPSSSPPASAAAAVKKDGGGGAAATAAAPPPPPQRKQKQKQPQQQRKSSLHRSSSSGNDDGSATTTITAPTAPPPPSSTSRCVRSVSFLLVHIVTLAVYIVPMLLAADQMEDFDHRPVLDELHIMSPENLDVNGNLGADGQWFWQWDLWAHDYWGRPLDAPHSHKSWRPLSVLLFRPFVVVSGADASPTATTLALHRLVGVATHAAAAELVGLLAAKLWHTNNNNNNSNNQPDNWEADVLRCLAKLAFSLHPAHVEVAANAANRPHLLALLCGLVACDPDTHFAAFAAAAVGGFLCCETFLFQVVPVAVTVWALAYLRRYHDPHHHPASADRFFYQILSVAWQPAVLLRWLWLAVTAVAYTAGRWHFDALSIPDGLIRPAENPFYELRGWTRVWSYARVFGVHVYKQWDWDYLGGAGSSHEYGYDCVSTVHRWRDARLLPVAAVVVGHAALAAYLLWWRQRRRTTLSRGCVLFLVYVAWTATLFPITGIIKVGTFIADRIVVASTVPVALLQARAATTWIVNCKTNSSSGSDPRRRRGGGGGGGGRYNNNYRWWLLGLWAALAWRRVYVRTQEWMDPLPLLESSLRTCPRFAKAHLEMSKIYSGLYPHRLNLTKARWHLERAEAIDPDYCDVHQQFAHVAGQEGQFSELEERLFRALLCPFTMGGTVALWQKYWNARLDPATAALGGPGGAAAALEENRRRYQSYQALINEAIAAEARREREQPQRKKKKSPLAVDWNRPTAEEL